MASITQKFTAGPFADKSTQEFDLTFLSDMPVVGSSPHTYGKPGQPQAIGAFGAITPATTPPPPPPSDGPNMSAALLAQIGFANVTRIDPGDAVMLNPAHYAIATAHSQGAGDAVTNTPSLAKYGQSFYGGPTDKSLHCGIASGKGLWMVGDQMPATGKWIFEAAMIAGGPDPFHAWGWGGPWVLNHASGQELDTLETRGWKGGDGIASSTYRDVLDHPIHSFYLDTFPVADGKPHTYTLAWDPVDTGKMTIVWDDVERYQIPIARPQDQMQIQITTGYTNGAMVPPAWDARSDNVYPWIRYYKAT